MKIAVCNYGSAGLWHYAASLANALAELPAVTHVRVYTSQYNKQQLLRVSERLSVSISPVPHTLGNFLWYSLQLKQHQLLTRDLSEFNPDVIHITDVYPLYLWHYFLLKKYPVIFTQHDPVIHTGDAHQVGLRWLQRYLQHLSQRIVVHGEAMKKLLMQHSSLDATAITSIPLGEFSILLPQSPLATTQREPATILFFGRVTPYKGLDVLLASLQQLQRQRSVFKLLIVGPGQLEPYQPALKSLKEVEIVNQYVPDSKVHQYFSRATMVVLPYREATQSSVVSLALPAGVPIIATRVGAIPEVLQDNINSLLVEPNQPDQLAQAITKLLADSQLRKDLQANGLTTAQTTLAWSTIAQQHMNIYQQLFANKKNRS